MDSSPRGREPGASPPHTSPISLSPVGNGDHLQTIGADPAHPAPAAVNASIEAIARTGSTFLNILSTPSGL